MHPQMFAASMTGMNDSEAFTLCVVLVIIGGTIVSVTKLVSNHIRRVQRDDMEATLKMEMIQRGMSPAEIKEVLEAGMGTSKGELLGNLESAGAGLVHRAVGHALDLEEMVQERKAKRVS